MPVITNELKMLRMRLLPLLAVEESLRRKLIPEGSTEEEATQLSNSPKRYIKEIAINSACHWKDTFSRLVNSERESFESQDAIDWNDPNDPGILLHACSQDIIRLWKDPTIQKLLKKQNLMLEEVAGFFLDSIERVTSTRYVPTDDDILRARLKTLGVSEHRFKINGSSGMSRDWRVFDVGGHRSQRTAWASYFDDMDAIIFLAPISCFDQVLDEEPKINRLQDSVALWTDICQNELLQHTNLIIFLNKIDIMKAKLAAGIRLADYVVSYGSRPNDFASTSTYLKRKFGSILKEHSKKERVYYSHFTTVTDTASTKYILSNLKDMIMRHNLMKTNLLLE